MKRAQRRALARSTRPAVDPFGASHLRRAIVLLVAAKVAGLILFLSLDGFDGFQPPKSAFSRVLETMLVVAIALLVVRYGANVLPRTRLHWVVVFFALANVAAAATAENRYLALYGDVTRLEGLTYIGDMVVLYFAVAVAYRGIRDWAALVVATGAAGIVAIAYAIVQLARLDPVAW